MTPKQDSDFLYKSYEYYPSLTGPSCLRYGDAFDRRIIWWTNCETQGGRILYPCFLLIYRVYKCKVRFNEISVLRSVSGDYDIESTKRENCVITPHIFDSSRCHGVINIVLSI